MQRLIASKKFERDQREERSKERQRSGIFIIRIFNLLTPMQWLLLFFALHVVVAHAIDATQNMKNKEKLKRKVLDKVCKSKALRTANKPDDAIMDYRNGTMVPIECVPGGVRENATICKEKQKRDFMQDDSVMQIRNKTYDKLQTWTKSRRAVLKQAMHELPPDKYSLLEELIKSVAQLKESQISAKEAEEFGKGNCGEHTDKMQWEIFLYNHQYDLDIKALTVFGCHLDDTKFKHSFLLITETEFVKKGRVFTFGPDVFERLTGKICDTWNYNPGDDLVDIKNNQNWIYSPKAEYTTVKVTQLPLRLDNIADLPEGSLARKFFCDELKDLGLTEGTTIPACRFFQPKKEMECVGMECFLRKK